MCSCGLEPEATLNYLLCCDLHSIYGLELMDGIYTLHLFLIIVLDYNLLNILLHKTEELYSRMNIYRVCDKFFKKVDRVSNPLFRS